MNIAIINVVGTKDNSTGKIAAHLLEYYTSLNHKCIVCYGRGKRIRDSRYFKINNFPGVVFHYLAAKKTKKEGYYSRCATRKLIKICKRFKPELIFLMNLHGHYLHIPKFMAYLGKSNLKVICAINDDFPFTAWCTYAGDCRQYQWGCKDCPVNSKNAETQYLDKKTYYDRLGSNLVFSSCEYMIERAKESGLLSGRRLMICNPGIDTEFYKPRETSKLRRKLGIPKGCICLLDAAKYSNKRKGVRYFIEAARMMEGDERFVFIHVGYDGETGNLPSNLIVKPYISDQEVMAQYYSLADVFICTSTEDAMPNVCIEAMSCGTPVMAFGCSGMPYLGDFPVLTLVEQINGKALCGEIKKVHKKDHEIMMRCRNHAIEKFDKKTCFRTTLEAFKTG